MSSPLEIAAQVLEAVFAGRLGSDVDLLAEKR
jgi:hypothetical protein